MHPPGKRIIDINRGQNHHYKANRHRYARADTAVRPYAEVCDPAIHNQTFTPNNATAGGMWSGWAVSRTGQLSDTASQHPFGGWQGGHHPRWQYPPPQPEMITPAIWDGRPTWPPDVTAKPSRTDRSTGFRVTSGEIGTHAMHPPRKRESIGTNAMHPPGTRIIDINKRPKRINTRGRTYVIHPSTWQA
jgi:hypothetical protein